MAVATGEGKRRALAAIVHYGACFLTLTCRNLANFLTAARLFAALPLFILILVGRMELAFWLFLIAAITDLVDGSVAKYLSRPTRFGALLDPIADKLFLGLLFLALALVELLPWWLTGLVILRDVAIAGGTLLLRHRLVGLRIEPLVIGKLCTLVQLLFLGVVLGQEAGIAETEGWRDWLLWAVVGFTVASGIAYFGAGVRLIRHAQSA